MRKLQNPFAPAAGADEPQSIEALQARHRDLERRKIQAESDLSNLERQLDEARGEARAQFGTDDLEELRRLLERMREENLARRREYEGHLDGIDARLREIEAAHAAAGRDRDGDSD